MKMFVSLDGVAARLFWALALAPIAGCGNGGTPCDGAVPLEVNGEATGFETCEGPWLHREEVLECPTAVPRDTTCGSGSVDDQCQQDSDCTEAPNGYCTGGGGDVPGCYCAYGCTKDADCGSGQICLCSDPVGYCASATCKSDADCGGNRLCSTYVVTPGCGGTAFACQSRSDECASDADCAVNQQCTYQVDHRVCGDMNCVIGRPFLVEGAARLAGVERRRDWCAEAISPRIEGLSEQTREVLAEEWARCAQMEHASIAAFARFSMQLLSLGAPPELLEATHAAMADETEHARACFAMASAYAGAPIGPGRLAMDGALGATDAAEIVRLAIVEGCIGETIAAVEAGEAAARAEDPAVRALLAKIAEDEARHSELAWRFVKWAIDSDARLAAAAASAFEVALAAELARASSPVSSEEEGWLSHGVARGAAKAAIRRRVAQEVVAPAARALLGRKVAVPRAAVAA